MKPFLHTASLTLLAILALAGAAAAQQTWYVDVAGVPPGDGSQANPYTSIQYGILRPTTQTGDTFVVAPGTYAEDVGYNNRRVHVRSVEGPLATRIDGRANLGVFNGPSDASLEGFRIESAVLEGGSLIGCIVVGTSSSTGVTFGGNVLIRNCTIVGFFRGVEEMFFNATVGSRIESTLLYGNLIDLDLDQQDLAHNAGVSYSFWKTGDLGAWTSGGTPTAAAPGLWNFAAQDFHLAPLSACIDAGVPTQTDPDGSRVDIGALAYDASYAATPTTYCTPKTTSLGCAPLVTWTGSASLSGPDDFVLTAAPALNKKVGKFIWGTVPKASPFAGGTLCVKLPFVRGPHLNSGGSASGLDCSGAYSWHFSQAYMASKSIPAGSILYAQAWGRDPGFADPNNSQLSDAIVFLVEP
ncbi:MAG: hypothetical protein HZA52_15030 [Planctomycetes bacterium]|nr:hypothetical protein [Planctomycetota bacterium]